MQFLKFTLLLFIITSLSYAQQEERAVKTDSSTIDVKEISEAELESYKKDKDFNYIEETEKNNLFSKFMSWLNNILKKIFESIFGIGNAGGILYFIFNILPYAILAFLLYLLVKFFLKVNSNSIITSSQSTPTVVFTEEEQILKNEDIQVLINEAVNQKNYRLAIRYYYLLSLKYLSENQIILWQLEKTNNDYIAEIKKEKLQHEFENITKIYDHVWYGEFSIDKTKFETLRVSFENLNNSI